MFLVDWLVQRYPAAKRQTLKRMLESGRVRVNGRQARRLKQEVAEGDRIEVDESGRRHEEPPRVRALPIVYEDADVLVVNKPAGLLTSTVPREPRPTLLTMVREYLAAKEPE